MQRDIVFIGSGIACTGTLIEVFERLLSKPHQPKIHITVIEKHHEFWLGVPYGGRSSVNALTITSIYDFFTADDKRAQFFAWLKINQQDILNQYLEKGGLGARQWLERNGKAIENEDWKNVYTPRFIVGIYQQEIFKGLLKAVEEHGLADIELIQAEVTDATPIAGGAYEITFADEHDKAKKIQAKKVVIATGSAPVREMNFSFGDDMGITYINDLYHPGADINLNKIKDALAAAQPGERNLLVIGTNASSIEFLYLLAGLPEITGLMDSLVMVSRSGLLPYHIIDKTLGEYPCTNLDQIKAEGNYTIKTLVAAAMQDIKPAVKDGVILPYIDRIIGYTLELLQALDEDAKKQFLGIYGMQLSNLFRRSGADYKGGAGVLLQMKKLVLLKGSFVHIEPKNNSGILHYTDPQSGLDEAYTTPFKAVLNCTGADDLDKSVSSLLNNLVHNKIAQVNLSGKGFYVNEHFEAAPNLYVMGPLLGGNMNKRIHFWHLENASRIMYLAPFLAEELLGGNK